MGEFLGLQVMKPNGHVAIATQPSLATLTRIEVVRALAVGGIQTAQRRRSDRRGDSELANVAFAAPYLLTGHAAPEPTTSSVP